MNPYREFLLGWPVVLASLLGIALGMSPLPFYTINVFVEPLSTEFGWSQSVIQAGLIPFTLTAVVASPLIGIVADRLGVRIVALTSIVLFSLCFMAFSLNTGSLVLYYSLWALLALCGVGTLPITFTRAISNWFHEKRGLALGIALIGTGVSGALCIQLAAAVLSQFGWRAAYVAIGLLPLLIALPVTLLLFRDIDDPKVKDKADALRAMHRETDIVVPVYGLTMKQAFMDWRFWLLAAVFAPLSFAIGGPIPNLVTMMSAHDFEYGDAIFLASCVGYAVFVGRLVGGFLLDHIWAPLVACVMLIMPALSMYLLAGDAVSYGAAFIAICLLGVAAGMEFDLLAYLVSRYFGIRAYSGIYGGLYSFFALGAGIGPAVYGRVYEQTGAFVGALQWSMWAFIFCSLALLLLGPYRDDKLRAMVD